MKDELDTESYPYSTHLSVVRQWLKRSHRRTVRCRLAWCYCVPLNIGGICPSLQVPWAQTWWNAYRRSLGHASQLT